jgi:hypothetical protein
MRAPFLCVSVAALSAAGLLGLASLPDAAGQGPDRPRPVWTERPKSDDSIYTYCVGHAVGRDSAAAVRQAAVEDAASRLLGDLTMKAGLGRDDVPEVKRRVTLAGLEPIPDAVHYETTEDGVACWIMVSYPLTERARLVETIAALKEELNAAREARLAFDGRLNEAYRKARAAALSGDPAGALALLREPLDLFGRISRPEFEIEEAQLLAGDLNRDRNEPLAARAIYEAVTGTSTSRVWREKAAARLSGLPGPPRLWPLRARLGGGPMALVMASQTDGGAVAGFQALQSVVRRDLVECRIPESDIGELSPAQMEGLFAGRPAEAVCRAAAAKGARVLLAAICRLDSTLKGRTRDLMGVAMPLPDSTVEMRVVDVEAQTVLYAGQFKEVTGTLSPSKSAERIASIMINKYLVPQCPAMAGPVPDRARTSPGAGGGGDLAAPP